MVDAMDTKKDPGKFTIRFCTGVSQIARIQQTFMLRHFPAYDNRRLSYDATENCLYLPRADCIIIKNIRSVYYGIK